MPYKNCWFDYKVDTVNLQKTPPENVYTRSGLLVKEAEYPENVFSVHVFNYMKLFKLWVLSPLSYIVSVNNPLYMKKSNMMYAELLPLDSGRGAQAGKEDGDDLTVLNMALMLLSCKNIATMKNPAPEALNRYSNVIQNNTSYQLSYFK